MKSDPPPPPALPPFCFSLSPLLLSIQRCSERVRYSNVYIFLHVMNVHNNLPHPAYQLTYPAESTRPGRPPVRPPICPHPACLPRLLMKEKKEKKKGKKGEKEGEKKEKKKI